MEKINLMNGDCLDLLKTIESDSIDAVIADPPYGTMKGASSFGTEYNNGEKTFSKEKSEKRSGWDDVIDNKILLEELNRVLKVNGVLILFGQEPFTSMMITNQHGNLPFSYRMVWSKMRMGNHLLYKKAPVSYFEDIMIFYKKSDSGFKNNARKYVDSIRKFIGKNAREVKEDFGSHRYMCFLHYARNGAGFRLVNRKSYEDLVDFYNIKEMSGYIEYDELYELYHKDLKKKTFNLREEGKAISNILEHKKEGKHLHPTQKPVSLMEDLVKIYTNEGEVVLDFCMGSGSTGVACKNLNREFIGFEKSEEYFEISKKRLTTIG